MTRPENPELIAAIRKAVLELTAKKDPAAVTMREIASRCNVTPTTIYYYFENKERLFEAVKFDIIDDLDNILAQAVNEGDPVKKQLADLMRAFVGWYVANPNQADLVFDKLPPATDLTDERLLRYYKANRLGRDIIIRAKETGELAVGDAELDTALGLAFMYGVVKLFIHKRLMPRFWDDITPLTDRMIELLLAGLAPKIK
ncbi:MAG: TetR/AcrR family transcriptional regulator [Deltaproteobacteria bacterium]|nr:TetR/AcrR family transcriptional regulator [Candidatus Zymogenaceae bacterium]